VTRWTICASVLVVASVSTVVTIDATFGEERQTGGLTQT